LKYFRYGYWPTVNRKNAAPEFPRSGVAKRQCVYDVDIIIIIIISSSSSRFNSRVEVSVIVELAGERGTQRELMRPVVSSRLAYQHTIPASDGQINIAILLFVCEIS